jgi:hypothetical protein
MKHPVHAPSSRILNWNNMAFYAILEMQEFQRLHGFYGGDGMRDRDKFRGCLIGGAAGDALGYAVEFLREGQIFRRYGERGITEYENCTTSLIRIQAA